MAVDQAVDQFTFWLPSGVSSMTPRTNICPSPYVRIVNIFPGSYATQPINILHETGLILTLLLPKNSHAFYEG